MKSFMFWLLIAFLLILISPASAAPEMINYQGRITNPAGKPITTPFDITFTFWDAETDGTQLGTGYSDTDTVTADASGIYSTMIGDDHGTPIPVAVFSGDSVWLNVRINGENLTPRKRIVSAGYALRSAQADTATTASRALSAVQADNAGKLGGQSLSDLAAAAHTHAADDVTSGLFFDARVDDILTISAAGSVDGDAIKSGTVAALHIDASIARDKEILPAVLAGDGPGSTLDADMLDGQQSSAFMSAATDNWVNTSGDTMTGALAVAGSPDGPLVNVANNRAGDIEAIRGTASGTGAVSNRGGYFEAAGDNGLGVVGVASGTSGRGVSGIASGASGRGVYGIASAKGSAANYGGRFDAAGNSGSGVYGFASATGDVTNYGGTFEAKGNDGRGVQGVASGTLGKGVYGIASAKGNVANYGGRFEADGNSGSGVFGFASATGDVTNYGGAFEAKGNSGRGVQGLASTQGDVTNYGGRFVAAGDTGRGVSGTASAAGAVENYGGFFTAMGNAGNGVYANASGASGIGVRGIAGGTSGIGVLSSGKAYDFYASGTGTNYGPFTGAHEVQFAAGFPTKSQAGMIVVAAGPAKVRRDESGQVSISSTLPTVRLADRPNDKAVFGVLVKEMPLPQGHWYQPAAGERFGVVNALGEGRVWVCSATGPVELGDFITTSAVPGYGQKQGDDLPHAYTVGKAIESVDWSAVTDTIEYNGQVYKVYLIAVVYTCG